MNAPAAIGHNRSPEELFAEHVDDLMLEAGNFLDGGGVKSQDEADAIGVILDRARAVRKDADAARAAEKKPHDEAGKAVQAKWKPIIDRADLAADTCKKALAPFLAAEQAKKDAEAKIARLIVESEGGVAATLTLVAAMLSVAATGGYTAEGEAKAAGTSEATPAAA